MEHIRMCTTSRPASVLSERCHSSRAAAAVLVVSYMMVGATVVVVLGDMNTLIMLSTLKYECKKI